MTNDPVTGGLQVAQSISEVGFLTVAAGFFVVLSITQQWFNNKRYDKLLKANENRYESMFNQVLGGEGISEMIAKVAELTTTTSNLVTPIKTLIENSLEATKEECTYPQASRVVRTELRVVVTTLVDATKAIIRRNNIKDENNHTRDKTQRIVINSIAGLKAALTLYKYNGVRFSAFIDDDHIVYPLVESIYVFIMSSNRDYEKLKNDLIIILEDGKSKIRENLGVS